MLLRLESLLRLLLIALIAAALSAAPSMADDDDDDGGGRYHQDDDDDGDDDDDDGGKNRKHKVFNRIATFPVFLNTNVETETVAEIVTASKDGKTLIYTDGETDAVGFVDISDPENPQPGSEVSVGGEPTSVSVVNGYALVAVNTSADFVNTSGNLVVVDISTGAIVTTIPLGGQPDSIAVSPSKKFAAIAIENERDEDLGSGEPPQAPPGALIIVRLKGAPAGWTTRTVDMTGLANCRFPEDPEPEFVDIRWGDLAAVSLQENNCVALVRLRSGRVIGSFDAGGVDLDDIDTAEDDIITLNSSQANRLREPDAIAWIKGNIATANEGDLDGGSRGFTIFDKRGRVRFESGESLEHIIVRHGHYPEDRSENKGNEPEGVEVGRYHGTDYLFVGSERSNTIGVYKVRSTRRPEFIQLLPTGVGPEGLLAIPKRGLFVVASEVDDRGDKIRSSITIYRLERGPADYPTVASADRTPGLPIPWAALSALAGDRDDADTLYTAHDSFYNQSRFYEMDVSDEPAVLTREIVLNDGGSTVNLDLEGLVQRADGSFWLVSEGSGSVDDVSRPVTSLNLLLKVAADGTILQTVELPAAVNALQRRFGFEGVAVTGEGASELVYVAFQREWVDDPDDQVRIGRYDPNADTWTFFYYPIDVPTSPNGGWVGLSEIVALDEETFAVIERDNQGGTDATIKQLATFSIAGLTPQPQGGVFPLLTKTVVRDLIPDLLATGGSVLEKVEGLTLGADGQVYIVTDNDGVDDASGETQFQNLGDVADAFN